MRAKEFITELGYQGNIGMMEMMKFYQVCTPEQKAELKSYIAAGNNKAAWKLLHQVTGVKLHGDEFATEDSSNDRLIFSEEGDWNTRVYITARLGSEYQSWLHGDDRPEVGEVSLDISNRGLDAYVNRIDVSYGKGQGYGTMLLTEAMIRAKEHGVRTMTAYIEHRNPVSKSLFRKAGFIEQPEKEWETQYGRYWEKKL
jgi:hypothetical protein